MSASYPDWSLRPIAIVDDCDDDVFLLRNRLREGGISNPIMAFSSAADALFFLRSCSEPAALPEIMFTDIRMPVDSGFALISLIRDNPEWSAIRLVVISSSNSPADLEHSLACGANGYLIKFPPSDILAEFIREGPWISIPHAAPAS